MWTMVLLLGLGMAIDPARLGLAVVMLSRRRPMLNLFAFWVGGMVAGVGIALAVLVFMRDVALAAIQGVVSAANEFREAVGIWRGGVCTSSSVSSCCCWPRAWWLARGRR
ncbi:Conserved membrane protein of uncharacterised function [Mycobacterium tuberculosis]|nr:Conserved membrane protein of uncharacterised function [Mycobacterium tuberculosis]